MRWSDEITLIKQTPAGVNANGFPLPPAEESRLVYCNKLSTGISEFYRSAQAGIKIEAKLVIRAVDYDGETIAELDGQRYSILRTYNTDTETLELTLTDLKQ